MKKYIIALLAGMLLLSGCATVKQAKDDITTGYTAPAQVGEVLPQEVASNVTNVVSAAPIPFAATAAVPIGMLAGAIAAWFRGRQIRKNQPTSQNPITGTLGNAAGVETIIQTLSTVSQGITEVFKEGSSAQHVWQGILTALVGIGGAVVAVPAVRDVVVHNPSIAIVVSGLAGVFNGVQQALTKVLPVEKTSTLKLN